MTDTTVQFPLGLTGTASVTVTEAVTARHMGSGAVSVFSTPEMVRLMEMAAVNALAPHLADGQQTVGTLVNVRHLAATPLGATVVARAELVGVEKRRFTFRVSASDGAGTIGEGVHERALIDLDRFEQRAAEKRRALNL